MKEKPSADRNGVPDESPRSSATPRHAMPGETRLVLLSEIDLDDMKLQFRIGMRAADLKVSMRDQGQQRPADSLDPGEAREYERLVRLAQGRRSTTAGLGLAAAAEIAHEAVVGYFLAVSRGESIQDSQAYVLGAARRQAAMLRRTRARSPNVPIEEAQAVVAAAPPVDTWDTACLMESMPGQLALWLADLLRDVTDRELAQHYGISVEAVQKRRQRALDWTRDVFLSGQDRGVAAT